MEVRTRANTDRAVGDQFFGSNDGIDQRLAKLLEINATIEKERSAFTSERGKIEAATMIAPLSAERAFSIFGLLVGALVPAAIFFRLLWDSGLRLEDSWIFIFVILTNGVTAMTGFFTGRLVGRLTSQIHRRTLGQAILLLPFLGLIWGMVAGAAGGVFMFFIGAIVGAVVGGAVGAVSLPTFALLHRFVSSGDMIERRQFLPLAFGVTLTICSLILGF